MEAAHSVGRSVGLFFQNNRDPGAPDLPDQRRPNGATHAIKPMTRERGASFSPSASSAPRRPCATPPATNGKRTKPAQDSASPPLGGSATVAKSAVAACNDNDVSGKSARGRAQSRDKTLIARTCPNASARRRRLHPCVVPSGHVHDGLGPDRKATHGPSQAISRLGVGALLRRRAAQRHATTSAPENRRPQRITLGRSVGRTVGQPVRRSAKLAAISPALYRNLGEFGRCSATFDICWFDAGHLRPNIGQFCRHLTGFG